MGLQHWLGQQQQQLVVLLLVVVMGKLVGWLVGMLMLARWGLLLLAGSWKLAMMRRQQVTAEGAAAGQHRPRQVSNVVHGCMQK